MKSVKETLLDRRSIRRYEREAIPQETMDFIYEAIRNTPTSYNGQQFSVIDITDQDVKEELYQLTNQKQIKTCNHFLLFCADFHKIKLLAKEKNIAFPDFNNTADGLIVGTVDAALAMMSALTAAESCGLATCCIGYARTVAPEAVSKIARLPQDTYVVCGLALGIPRELPDLKPKQPSATVIHRDHYSTDDELLPALKGYDAEITRYNATRSGTKSDNDWAAHIISYYDEAMDYNMKEALRHRGFDIKS